MWLLIALAAVALLFAVPLDLAVVWDTRPAGPRRARLVWGFGLIRIRLRRGHETKPRRARPRGRMRTGRRARAALFTPHLPAAVVRRVGRIIAAVRIRRLEAQAHLGTGDPADTGVLFGAVSGALAALPPAWQASIAVVPDFDAERSDLWVRGSLRVIPGVVLGHLLALVLSPAALHGFVRMRRA